MKKERSRGKRAGLGSWEPALPDREVGAREGMECGEGNQWTSSGIERRYGAMGYVGNVDKEREMGGKANRRRSGS